MQLESKKLLEDMRQALGLIERFAQDRSREDYLADDMLRSSVERQFEILGEALRQLIQHDPETAEQFSERRRIIAFRNILVHAYDKVDDHVVWDVVQEHVPVLQSQVESFLKD